ncbi:uncharacterized protein EI90DRAFT_2677705 [Cantharellus anzutake]|uniref:uncharacterized protein n=1 Tax=Cantharellus anzutake TaxID=1750568 RepID=UPI001904D625|nr:uncharacterized protein EI90DRAFT_2677705 [Cantharellus anzutake]KAF8319475.1 hypothetical protein EI90DRAFT_2677705 [Cantharellus anzutake]
MHYTGIATHSHKFGAVQLRLVQVLCCKTKWNEYPPEVGRTWDSWRISLFRCCLIRTYQVGRILSTVPRISSVDNALWTPPCQLLESEHSGRPVGFGYLIGIFATYLPGNHFYAATTLSYVLFKCYLISKKPFCTKVSSFRCAFCSRSGGNLHRSR